MAHDDKLNLEELQALAAQTPAGSRPGGCAIDSFREWTRVPAEFPEQHMRTVGTLVDDPFREATWDEYHPQGSNYWSPAAPIALRHFPYNRCVIWQCAACGRCALHYVEAGGYYVEKRIRALDQTLIVDVPA
jgi:hypothetical protein